MPQKVSLCQSNRLGINDPIDTVFLLRYPRGCTCEVLQFLVYLLEVHSTYISNSTKKIAKLLLNNLDMRVSLARNYSLQMTKVRSVISVHLAEEDVVMAQSHQSTFEALHRKFRIYGNPRRMMKDSENLRMVE